MLDTDLYKLTQMQAIASRFPYAQAEYTFTNRGKTPFPRNFHHKLQDAVCAMKDLSLTAKEKKFLEGMGWFKPTFLDLLSGYRFDPDEVSIDMRDGGDLQVSIEGPWYRTVLWEVPLMAIISELFFQDEPKDPSWKDRIVQKGMDLKDIRYAEFGTRRRFSFEVQDEVVSTLKGVTNRTGTIFGLVGTSNVHLAMKHGLKAIGTQAHEWIMAFAAIYGFRMANFRALEGWAEEYEGSLGIALTDTYGTDDFFRAFDLRFSKLFDGVRHDSGEPVEFAKKAIAHYQRMGIDPRAKTIVFSDNLNVKEVWRIADFCEGRVGYSFGIGTHMSNDVGVKPLNMVIKLTGLAINQNSPMIPCVKLSDVPGKHNGSPEMIDLCLRTLSSK